MQESHNPTAHQSQPQLVKLSQIQLDPEIQPRQQLNQEVIAEYAEAMKQGAKFPPVIVFYDNSSYWLADGFHRVNAKEQVGECGIFAEVRSGSRRDAVLHAVGANTTYGLQRSNADKRRAVERLLQDHEWKNWSNREIARRCGVHHQLVGNLRNKLYSLDSSSYQFRKGGDGRIIDITNIGKREKNSKPSNETNKRILAYAKNT